MPASIKLAFLAVRPLAEGACKAAGFEAGSGAVAAVAGFLEKRFTDHSRELTEALHKAHDRAWTAVELSLAGDSWWQSVKSRLAAGDQRGFRDQVQAFIQQVEPDARQRESLRRLALAELRAARKDGLLDFHEPALRELAGGAAQFARFADPDSLRRAELDAALQIGDDLKKAGYENLARWIAPDDGPPLLAVAAQYFFRRAVEEDERLFHGLAFAKLDQLQETQERAFAGLYEALSVNAARLEDLLGSVKVAVAETRDAVLDIQAEQQRQGEQFADIYQAIIATQQKLDLLHKSVRPKDSLSIRGDHERQLVKSLVARYRALPESRRHEMPALLNAVGQLEIASGDFDAAQKDFQEVATLVPDDAARGTAHMNAYRAALERRDFEAALYELRAAIDLDADRYAPFPVDKYRPTKILGAGGFGVAFLCHHEYLNAPVVVKTLQDDGLDIGIEQVFTEAQALRQVDHPAIIRVQDCAYADTRNRARPYLVMDYFNGVTLDTYIANAGPLAAGELIELMRPVAEGLSVAHAQGILHRDIKPANLLIRRDGMRWTAKLIDFGLALRPTTLRDTKRTGKTIAGSSIAGTIDFGAPEQLGKRDDPVGPPADVYGFGKTCCFALFQTASPLQKHWKTLPPILSDLLNRCLDEDPKARPRDAAVLARCFKNLAEPAEVLPAAEEAGPRRTPRREVHHDDAVLPAPRRPSRYGWLKALLIAGLILAVPAGGLYLMFNRLNRPFAGFVRPRSDQQAKLEISPVIDDDSAAAFEAKLKTLTGSDSPWSERSRIGDKLVVAVAPVPKGTAQQFADKITGEYGPVVTKVDEFFQQINVDGAKIPVALPATIPVSLEEAQGRFASATEFVYLTDLKPFAVRNGYFPVRFDGTLAEPGSDPWNREFGKKDVEHFITVNGVKSPHGISMHPADRGGMASAWFRLGKSAKRLEGAAAINDSATQPSQSGVVFEVVGDGKLLWKSDPLKAKGDRKEFSINVESVDLIRLRTATTGHYAHAHAVWVEPRAVK